MSNGPRGQVQSQLKPSCLELSKVIPGSSKGKTKVHGKQNSALCPFLNLISHDSYLVIYQPCFILASWQPGTLPNPVKFLRYLNLFFSQTVLDIHYFRIRVQ